MATPEFIDGGTKLVLGGVVAVRDGSKPARKAAADLAALFTTPDDVIALMGRVIEGDTVPADEIEAPLAAMEADEERRRLLAKGLAERNVEPLLLKPTRKTIKGGPLLPRIAGGKVSLAPSVRRTIMYHANEEHRGGAREVVRLFKECVTLNEHCEALLFEAGLLD